MQIVIVGIQTLSEHMEVKKCDGKVDHETIISMSTLTLFSFLTLMLLIFELSSTPLCRTIMLSTEFQ